MFETLEVEFRFSLGVEVDEFVLVPVCMTVKHVFGNDHVSQAGCTQCSNLFTTLFVLLLLLTRTRRATFGPQQKFVSCKWP